MSVHRIRRPLSPTHTVMLLPVALSLFAGCSRSAALETIAAGDGRAAIELFQTAAADAHSQVRRAAIRILGGMGDQTMVPFFRNRFVADDSYLVQVEALRAIGRSGDQSQLEFLRQASEMSSPRDVIENAASWAIEELAGRRPG